MSSEASLFAYTRSHGSLVVEAHASSTGAECPAPATCPPQLSEEAIASIPLELPPLDESRMSPAVISAAKILRMEYAIYSSRAQSDLLSLRKAWLRWHELPMAPGPPGIQFCHSELFKAKPLDPLFPSLTEPAAALRSQPASMESASNASLVPSPPTASDSPIDYAKSIALSAKRRDDAHMKGVFERHKDVDGGLSKAAFIAALKEVEAPVLFSSDSASEDDLFRRADTNASGSVDLSEYALPGSDTHCVCGN